MIASYGSSSTPPKSSKNRSFSNQAFYVSEIEYQQLVLSPALKVLGIHRQECVQTLASTEGGATDCRGKSVTESLTQS